MQTTTPLSRAPASPCSSLPSDRPRSLKDKHSNSHGFTKMTSLSSSQHPLQYRTPRNEKLVHDVGAGSRPGLFKTPPSKSYSDLLKTRTSTEQSTGSISGFRMALCSGSGLSTPYRSEIAGDLANNRSSTPEPPSPVNQASQSRDLLKTRTSTEKSTGSISGFRMALCSGGGSGLSTPYRSEIAGDLANNRSRTPEPPSPVNQASQSSLQWLRGSVGKNSASLSELKASLAAVAQQSSVSQQSPRRSSASLLGTYSDTSGSIHSYRPRTQGSRGITPGSSSKVLKTPELFRKCKDEPSLFNVRLQLSDDSDGSENEKRKPGFSDVPVKRGSGCPKRFPSTSTCHKRNPSSSVPPQSSVHKLSAAKGPLSGMRKNGAYSSQPQQLQQQCPSMRCRRYWNVPQRHSSKIGCVPSKASHVALAEGAALDSLLPSKAASVKSEPSNYKGAGPPVEDGASGGRPCRAALEEHNDVLHSHQPEARQVLEVSQHSKRKSLLSVLLDVKPPTEDFYIEINEKRYHMLSLIGRGGSSKVFMMFDHRKDLCAVKLVNLADVPPSVMQAYMQEVAILKALRSCDRVVRLFDCELNKKDKVLALVMEKGDQDLATVLMNRKGNLGPVTIKFYWSEMLQAVKEIHDKRVVHSDLKPANFLFVAGKLKLIDFGIADKIQENVTSVLKESPMGTLNFMSPESIQYTSQKQGKDYLKIGLKSDVWSLGCILYNLVYGKTPFQHISATHAKLLAIVDNRQAIEFPDVSDPHLLDVLMKCLRRDPQRRPSISELLEHPYLVEEVMPVAVKQCKDPHVQSLISEIENLSPASVKKMKEMLKSMRKDKP